MSVPTIDGLQGVVPIVEMGVGSVYDDPGVAEWDVALWDDPSSTWVGDQPMWFDITCHVMDVQAQSGRERSLDLFDVGTATITCENESGWADYPQSMPDEPLLTIRPGRSIRVGMAVDGEPPVDLWAGYIDEANPSYDASSGAVMTFECVDALGDAGRVDLITLAAPAGAGETATARITRILNAGSWPPYRRVLETSGVAVRETLLGDQTISLLQRTAESVGGQIYGDLGADDRDPSIAFRGRDFAAYDQDDPIAGTISNITSGGDEVVVETVLVEDPPGSGLYDPGVVPVTEDPPGSLLLDIGGDYVMDEDPDGTGLYLIGELAEAPGNTCPNAWELAWDRAGITTRAILGRPDDISERVYDDQQGIALFGVETYKRTDLETAADVELDWLGNRILALRSWQYMPRVAAVTVTASQDHPQTIDTLLAASPFLPSRFVCQHAVGERLVFNRVMMVTGVQHSISPEMWQARIALDAAEPFLIGGTNPADWDEVGVALWDAATWSAPI